MFAACLLLLLSLSSFLIMHPDSHDTRVRVALSMPHQGVCPSSVLGRHMVLVRHTMMWISPRRQLDRTRVRGNGVSANVVKPQAGFGATEEKEKDATILICGLTTFGWCPILKSHPSCQQSNRVWSHMQHMEKKTMLIIDRFQHSAGVRF